jgi:iron-sulfur cluster assembly accessory protein
MQLQIQVDQNSPAKIEGRQVQDLRLRLRDRVQLPRHRVAQGQDRSTRPIGDQEHRDRRGTLPPARQDPLLRARRRRNPARRSTTTREERPRPRPLNTKNPRHRPPPEELHPLDRNPEQGIISLATPETESQQTTPAPAGNNRDFAKDDHGRDPQRNRRDAKSRPSSSSRNLDKPTKIRLRVGVKGGGCSGFSYLLDLTETARDDRRGLRPARHQRSSAIRSPTSTSTASTIDFKDEVMGRGFVFNNPNATSSCGCGSSFSA